MHCCIYNRIYYYDKILIGENKYAVTLRTNSFFKKTLVKIAEKLNGEFLIFFLEI